MEKLLIFSGFETSVLFCVKTDVDFKKQKTSVTIQYIDSSISRHFISEYKIMRRSSPCDKSKKCMWK